MYGLFALRRVRIWPCVAKNNEGALGAFVVFLFSNLLDLDPAEVAGALADDDGVGPREVDD